MEPTIITTIISALGTLASSLLQKWSPSDHNDKKDIVNFLNKHYPLLRSALTMNCVRILHATESGKPYRAKELRRLIYPEVKGDPLLVDYLDNEFEYRLRYLTAIGLLVSSIQSEYYISRLGAGFVEQARKTLEYHDVFHAIGA